MKIGLKDIADVRAGHTIRKSDYDPGGVTCPVVQIHNVVDCGELVFDNVKTCRFRSVPGASILGKGDVLFSARGLRNVAAVYQDVLAYSAVAASHHAGYFVSRCP